MREILFRGLRTDGKGWVYGDLSKMWNDTPFIMPKCYFATKDLGFNLDDPKEVKKMLNSKELAFGGFIEVIPETVGQYTGINDKNGVKIFEGDKIELFKNKNGFAIVKFGNAYVGGWILVSDKSICSLGARDIESLEVIGNIHEIK